MSLVYQYSIQEPNSPLAKSFAYKPMPYDPAAVVLQVNLRDYFAAAALQGILSNTEASKTWNESDVARFCYFQSDAMLKAREVKP